MLRSMTHSQATLPLRTAPMQRSLGMHVFIKWAVNSGPRYMYAVNTMWTLWTCTEYMSIRLPEFLYTCSWLGNKSTGATQHIAKPLKKSPSCLSGQLFGPHLDSWRKTVWNYRSLWWLFRYITALLILVPFSLCASCMYVYMHTCMQSCCQTTCS